MRRSSLLLAAIGLAAVVALGTLAIHPVWSRVGAVALPSTVSEQAEWLGDFYADWALELYGPDVPAPALEEARGELVEALRGRRDQPLTMRQMLDIQNFLAESLSCRPLTPGAAEADLRLRMEAGLPYVVGYLRARPLTVDEQDAIASQMAGLLDYFQRCLLEELTPAPPDLEGTRRVIVSDLYTAATRRVVHESQLAVIPRFERLLTDEEMAHMRERARYCAAESGAGWRDYRAHLLDFKGPGYTVLPEDLVGQAGGTASWFLSELSALYAWDEEAAP